MPAETPQTPPTPPGPKKTEIDLATVEKLAAIGCTLDEIGAVIGLSKRTLIRRGADGKFLEAIERGRAQGRMSLRRAQWKSAMGTENTPGNITAQIWLGKQLLGQRSFEREQKNDETAAPPPLIIQTWNDSPLETPIPHLSEPGPLPGGGGGA